MFAATSAVMIAPPPAGSDYVREGDCAVAVERLAGIPRGAGHRHLMASDSLVRRAEDAAVPVDATPPRSHTDALLAGLGGGQTLGGYLLLDRLGEGAMGVVLRARHSRMDRVVALKILSPKLAERHELVRRFHREARAAARLSHPNIVTAHDAGEADGIHYLVMECVDGTDFASLVRSRGPLPVEQAIDCIVQAARGLSYAHEQGVVHRDIKPSNLMLDRQGAVKILDMGLARIDGAEGADAAARAGLSAPGTIMGTADYMAPEQALDSQQAEARSDIYSLGCTLHFLLTGRPPYAGDTLVRKILAHREQPVPSLRAQRNVSPAVDALLRRMLAKRPDDRPQTMREVAKALDAMRAEHGGDATFRVATSVFPGTERPLRAVILSGTAALIVAALWWWGFATTGSRPATVADARGDPVVSHAPRAESSDGPEKGPAAATTPLASTPSSPELEPPQDVDLARNLPRAPFIAPDTSAYLRKGPGCIPRAFTRDGRWLITTGEADLVRVWDAATGRPHLTVPSNLDVSFGPTLARQSPLLAVYGVVSRATVWDVETFTKRYELAEHPMRIWCADFAPDDSILATVCDDGRVRLWNGQTGRLLDEIACSERPLLRVAFLPDGKRLAVTTLDPSPPERKFPGSDSSIIVLDIDRDSPTFKQTLRTWRASDAWLSPLVIAGDDRLIWFSGQNHEPALHVGDVTTGTVEKHPVEGPNHAAFLVDGKTLWMYGAGGGARSFNLVSKKAGRRILIPGFGEFSSFCLHPNGRTIAAGGASTQQAWLFDVTAGSMIPLKEESGSIEESRFQPLIDRNELDQWEVGGVDDWRVENGLLVGHWRPEPIPPVEAWLKTKRDFGDFELRFDFRFAQGESVVPVLLKGGPSQRYRLTGPASGIATTPNEWHQLRFRAEGTEYAGSIDGVLVSRGTFEELRGKGPLEFLLQDVRIEFRNLRVCDLPLGEDR